MRMTVCVKQLRLKGYIAFIGNPSRAMECRLPYGITQCYLSPSTGECVPLLPKPDSLVCNDGGQMYIQW